MSELKICSKCGEPHYCDKHHILPKKLFGDGETDYLCKNCHDKYHRFLGYKFLRKEHKQSEEFYYEKWYRWLYLVGAILIGILYFLNR